MGCLSWAALLADPEAASGGRCCPGSSVEAGALLCSSLGSREARCVLALAPATGVPYSSRPAAPAVTCCTRCACRMRAGWGITYTPLHFYRLMAQFVNHIQLEVLPPIHPTHEASPGGGGAQNFLCFCVCACVHVCPGRPTQRSVDARCAALGPRLCPRGVLGAQQSVMLQSPFFLTSAGVHIQLQRQLGMIPGCGRPALKRVCCLAPQPPFPSLCPLPMVPTPTVRALPTAGERGRPAIYRGPY